jgi:antitoxin PrlF
MASKNYSISPAKIGSQDGFRLPKAFSRDYPHLITAKGYIEMLDEKTFLVHLDPDMDLEDDEDDDESLTMKLFLDTLMKFAIDRPNSLTPYTQQMVNCQSLMSHY